MAPSKTTSGFHGVEVVATGEFAFRAQCMLLTIKNASRGERHSIDLQCLICQIVLPELAPSLLCEVAEASQGRSLRLSG